jgi:glycosyltransferase involved in cell wall biosynthesis
VIVVEQDPRAAQETALEVSLDLPLPRTLPVEQATAIFCLGTCFHPHCAVEELVITVDGARHRPTAQRMPRLDRFRSLHPTVSPDEAASLRYDSQSPRDPALRSYRSGFWATIPIEPSDRPGELEVGAEARLADGTIARASLGSIPVVERPEAPRYQGLPRAAGKPLIAICMATFNPDLALFHTQVESLRAQTDRDWICLISDDHSRPDRFEAIRGAVAGDARFVLSRSDERLGFYRNFERVLKMIPPEAEFVALCDHDDRWYPDKLAALRNAIGDAELAYSDQRLVDADGRVRRETLWRGRRNNHTNLASLLISNTIVGAASLFRRRVIHRAVPFPDGPGWQFHDHWLALVAMSLGDVVYVDRPLYDYVQHPGAVLGRVASAPEASARGRGFGLRARIDRWRGFPDRWRAMYFRAYLDREVQARVLLARCRSELTPRKRRALRFLIDAGRSPVAFAWLVARPARALLGRTETLGFEEVLVRGILWRHLIALRGWRRDRPRETLHDASLPRRVKPDSFGSKRFRRWLAHK